MKRKIENCSKYPIFSIKQYLKLIIAKQPVKTFQIDLVLVDKKFFKRSK